MRRCALMWGVQAALIPRHEITEELIAEAVKRAVELGWIEEGQLVGITAGLPSGRPGTTSLFQVQRVGEPVVGWPDRLTGAGGLQHRALRPRCPKRAAALVD